jgi:type 1 glutamine amidotransferase
MRVALIGVTVLALALVVPMAAQAPPQGAAAASQTAATRPIRVYIRAGLKTHGPGLHDYPQFLADWSNVLTERGAVVDGSLHFPTAQELANVDVMVMYKGDAVYMTADEKAVLESFLRRGGGLVSFHDTLCGDDPAWYATIVGGAKRHGEQNFSSGAIKYTITDPAHPIMQGMSNFEVTDEAFFRMTWSENPKIHVLATAPMPSSGEVVPQIWTYERQMFGGASAGEPFRAFVWMQGHTYSNFADPKVQPMILRGIAWAAKAPIDSLMQVRPARGGGGGRGGRGGRGAGAPAPAPGAGGAARQGGSN